MRLGFAIAAHLDADVLLLDEVFAVGDEEFQRKCFGKIFEFKQRGGTIVFVSHDALGGRAALRAGGAAPRRARSSSTGRRTTRSTRYHRAARRGARPGGARAPGSASGGAARRGSTGRGCSGPRASRARAVPRRRAARRCACASARGAALAPPRPAVELRDDAGMLVAGESRRHGDARLGRRPGEPRAALRRGRLPLADGRFHLRLGLVDAAGEHGSCTGSTTRSRSSSTRAATSAGSCGSREAGRLEENREPR